MKFEGKDLEIVKDVARELEEFHVEHRHGKSQTKYVMEVTSDDYWDYNEQDALQVPEHLKGVWMMKYASDLEYEALNDCLRDCSWVKCKQVEKTILVWEKIDDK